MGGGGGPRLYSAPVSPASSCGTASTNSRLKIGGGDGGGFGMGVGVGGVGVGVGGVGVGGVSVVGRGLLLWVLLLLLVVVLLLVLLLVLSSGLTSPHCFSRSLSIREVVLLFLLLLLLRLLPPLLRICFAVLLHTARYNLRYLVAVATFPPSFHCLFCAATAVVARARGCRACCCCCCGCFCFDPFFFLAPLDRDWGTGLGNDSSSSVPPLSPTKVRSSVAPGRVLR